MAETFPVTVSAGTLRDDGALFTSPHRWTEGGVSVVGAFTGAHLLHVAVGGCVLNDVYREAEDLGLDVLGVRVAVAGGFDPATWASTGVTWTAEVDAAAPDADVAVLLDRVEAVAEIPRAIAQGAPVTRLR
ncbi:OsmC family protein [Amnibacterium kyonggiense]|uniref:OsmC-like protein n=1 Tax=Amnibacterium kyonggiense TaxID=595671 RepID=A0A4R7FLW1_9MICO|nr:OsmC family peroxiredoxin [Amnibacterium kyonggiense]TDS77410.1 OsmC-like protein [Amnibacterium kyonggiense]